MSSSQWNNTFSTWRNGPGTTEQTRIENAERMIKAAVDAYEPFNKRSIKVFAQGSYRNRTNVKKDSDVDVCVLCSDTFFYDLQLVPEATKESLGFLPATYRFKEFREDLLQALVNKFGEREVTPGNKAFNIQENTYRITADVVPTFEGRLYHKVNGVYVPIKGTAFDRSDTGARIFNWPDQHHQNGVDKHSATSKQFKKKVRILKRLRHEMEADGHDLGATISSFLLECLVYNCPDEHFVHQTDYDRVRAVLIEIWGQLIDEDRRSKMVEVNGIKYLFRDQQPWNVEDAKTCVKAMWNFVGFQ